MARRCNSAAWRGDGLAFAARKRGDSGSHTASATTINNGTMPPTRKMLGQPKAGSSTPASWPQIKPPTGAPVKLTMIIKARRRWGA